MMVDTEEASIPLSQYQQYKKPGGENSKTAILENKLQAVQVFNSVICVFLSLYVHSQEAFPSKH